MCGDDGGRAAAACKDAMGAIAANATTRIPPWHATLEFSLHFMYVFAHFTYIFANQSEWHLGLVCAIWRMARTLAAATAAAAAAALQQR